MLTGNSFFNYQFRILWTFFLPAVPVAKNTYYLTEDKRLPVN